MNEQMKKILLKKLKSLHAYILFRITRKPNNILTFLLQIMLNIKHYMLPKYCKTKELYFRYLSNRTILSCSNDSSL